MFDVPVTAPSSLAHSTGLTRGAVSRLVDRLLQKNLVTRDEAAADRRFEDLRLTPAGRKLVPRLAALADKNARTFSGSSRRRNETAWFRCLRSW
jgi:DNA-binding MarR family transcriptional regulator